MNENKELNELLKKARQQNPHRLKGAKVRPPLEACMDEMECSEPEKWSNLVQWTSADGKRFIPASHTKQALTPGVYEIMHSPSAGLYFEKIPTKTEGLIRFPQTNCEKVVAEIEKFWDREDLFREYKLTYKRGIILWGPPGGGKSCTIQIVTKDVIDRGGIVIKFTNPHLFMEGMRVFREIQKDTPIVILMEDIDSTLEIFNESEVLNILDGIDQVEKAVFLATTNYPERLGARIINRPSRFDKRFKIDYPNFESRVLYIQHLFNKETTYDINKWAEDTDRFTLAHIKELFVAVVILGDDYENALDTLRTMKDITPDSFQDEGKAMGFNLGSRG